MKLLSIILAILVMFLTVQPVCGMPAMQQAADACCSAGCADEQEDDKKHHGEEKQDCGICNPFQSCSCCSGYFSLTHTSYVAPSPDIFYSSKEWGWMDCRLIEAPIDGFWQPPRA